MSKEPRKDLPYTEGLRAKILKALEACEPLPTQDLTYQAIYKICKEDIIKTIIDMEL